MDKISDRNLATPRPWEIMAGTVITEPKTGRYIASLPDYMGAMKGFDETRANAQLIVRAVNNFEGLLEAAKEAFEFITLGNVKKTSLETIYKLNKAINDAEKETT